MKILSIAVPCYNSAGYMKKCIDSLIVGGDDVEILIINDGSSDDTAVIADSYETRYPNIAKAIHQENLGHGGAVNTGLANATGLFFKVVDSDDWLDRASFLQVIAKLKALHMAGQSPDMLVCNYVYECAAKNTNYVMKYRSVFPQDRILDWSDVGRFSISQFLAMHAVIYRRDLLLDCGLQLPHHTFYVDNLFVYQPLPFVKTLYYMDVNLYRYLIGREGQSVDEQNMIQRIDQQIKVNKLMIAAYRMNEIPNPRLRCYMESCLLMVTTVTSIICNISKNPENITKKEDVWKFLREYDEGLYFKLRRRLLGILLRIPGPVGRKTTAGVYRVAQKIYKFN